ncbi:MAG TPA: low-specificity L-threonine aldolase [Bacteroidota bacterium]|nr:low-specificity L-threonine aldolase [Bacteroidota bacterium]
MAEHFIDLRSDTVTRPSPGMREAMANAAVGDDVFGEDPSVNRLQEHVAGLLGKEAALYVPSGTMGNQTCIKVHTQPGDEVICEKGAHVFNYETGGIAFLSGAQVHAIEGKRGAFGVAEIERAVRPDMYYMPKTRLICLENTHNRAGGTIYPLELIKSISAFARGRNIRLHLDGARLWNACAATGIAPREYASYFDSVSVCLSKGLGAPVGSVIAGSAAFIAEARHYRKIFGGGMRQAGILAAAGLYALEHNVTRLTEDHEKAAFLAGELARVKGFDIDLGSVQTNIIIIGAEKTGRKPEEILAALRAKGVLLTLGNYMGIRAVTHLDVSMDDVKKAARIIRETLG